MSYQIIQVTKEPQFTEEIVKDNFKSMEAAQCFLDKLAKKQGWTRTTSAILDKYIDFEGRIYFVRNLDRSKVA